MAHNQARSSLFTGHVPTHPFPEACPDPNPTLTQTLDLTQGRVGTWPTTKQGPFLVSTAYPPEHLRRGGHPSLEI